jgi:hypothetical protein
MKTSPLRPTSLACTILVLLSAGLVRAGEEVLFPVEDSFIRGGNSSTDPTPDPFLIVAARGGARGDDYRKIFLMFEVDKDATSHLTSSKLVLTYLRTGLAVNDGDPRDTFEVLLYGVPEGEWSDVGLTWDSAPFHDKQSATDEGNPKLTLLAQEAVNPLSVMEDGTLAISDPRLTEFLRKHPGRVTLIMTSLGSSRQPGLLFFDADGTSRPERKPRLILETK